MNALPRFQRLADEIREMVEGRQFDRDWPPDGYWVTVRGVTGRSGVQLAFAVGSDGTERLFLRTEGYSPPKKRTIRRWCAAFWGDDCEAEWDVEGTAVRCRPKAAVAETV